MKTTTLAAAAVHPPQTNPTKAEQSCLIRSQVRGNVRCEVVNLLDKKIALELGATVLNGQTEVIKRAVKLKSDQCSGLLDIMQVNSSKPHYYLPPDLPQCTYQPIGAYIHSLDIARGGNALNALNWLRLNCSRFCSSADSGLSITQIVAILRLG